MTHFEKVGSLRPVYYVGTHRYSFRRDGPGEIIGVKEVTNGKYTSKCFVVMYPDGFVDYKPIDDTSAYELRSEK
jgi:hypothetical protein